MWPMQTLPGVQPTVASLGHVWPVQKLYWGEDKARGTRALHNNELAKDYELAKGR